MTQYHEDGIYLKELPELMSKGMLDCEIMSQWNISKSTFYKWIKEHQEFKEAYEIGHEKRLAFYARKARENWEEGKDIGHKYFKSISTQLSDWKQESDKSQSVTNNSISINNMNMFDHESRENLLSYIQSKLQTLPMIQEVKLVEVDKEKAKVDNKGE